ncbi:hypothetical protein FCM35_KLT13301 [Carex littledalei]|uniref:Uncharacterized protein n=1 Tax=Carex littledalei TaxID=544730 RepID=A0A833QDF6_9POAL|nr:hypothetical protein FCM35_KLT13301 [Carex littledalei]
MEVWTYYVPIKVQTRIGQTLLIRGNSVTQTWFRSSAACAGGAKGKRLWATRFIAVLWHVRKHRNEAIFRGFVIPPTILASKIAEEMGLWV